MVAQLLAKDYAYLAANGDVMYAVARFAGYGRLSGRRLADLRAGARVEVDEAKRDPLDFVLWKHAKPGEPDRKSTRLNSSHLVISYAVFCLKKKKTKT